MFDTPYQELKDSVSGAKMQGQGQKYPLWGRAQIFSFPCALWLDKTWNLWTSFWFCSDQNFLVLLGNPILW